MVTTLHETYSNSVMSVLTGFPNVKEGVDNHEERQFLLHDVFCKVERIFKGELQRGGWSLFKTEKHIIMEKSLGFVQTEEPMEHQVEKQPNQHDGIQLEEQAEQQIDKSKKSSILIEAQHIFSEATSMSTLQIVEVIETASLADSYELPEPPTQSDPSKDIHYPNSTRLSGEFIMQKEAEPVLVLAESKQDSNLMPTENDISSELMDKVVAGDEEEHDVLEAALEESVQQHFHQQQLDTSEYIGNQDVCDYSTSETDHELSFDDNSDHNLFLDENLSETGENSYFIDDTEEMDNSNGFAPCLDKNYDKDFCSEMQRSATKEVPLTFIDDKLMNQTSHFKDIKHQDRNLPKLGSKLFDKMMNIKTNEKKHENDDCGMNENPIRESRRIVDIPDSILNLTKIDKSVKVGTSSLEVSLSDAVDNKLENQDLNEDAASLKQNSETPSSLKKQKICIKKNENLFQDKFCKICKKEFSRTSERNRHVKTFHVPGRPGWDQAIHIRLSGKSRFSKVQLIDSEARGKPLIKKKSATCQFCNERFLHKGHLYRHQRRIHKYEPLSMDEESRNKFKHVKIQKRSFKNEDNSICQFCNEKFLHKSHLYRHQRTIHKYEPFTIDNKSGNILKQTVKLQKISPKDEDNKSETIDLNTTNTIKEDDDKEDDENVFQRNKEKFLSLLDLHPKCRENSKTKSSGPKARLRSFFQPHEKQKHPGQIVSERTASSTTNVKTTKNKQRYWMSLENKKRKPKGELKSSVIKAYATLYSLRNSEASNSTTSKKLKTSYNTTNSSSTNKTSNSNTTNSTKSSAQQTGIETSIKTKLCRINKHTRYLCHCCEAMFDRKILLSKHLLKHHPKCGFIHFCFHPGCNRIFSDKLKLKRHKH